MWEKNKQKIVFLFLSFLTGCSCSDTPREPMSFLEDSDYNEVAMIETHRGVQRYVAVAAIHPLGGGRVHGEISFMAVPGGIRIIANLKGLKPGVHGLHIHEHGVCTGENGADAGAHFNPTNSKHGGPDSSVRHLGDLGNVIADEQGNAQYERIDYLLRLDGPHSIIGRSIIIHEDEDDFKTDPSGNSGKRIGCGLIEKVVLQ